MQVFNGWIAPLLRLILLPGATWINALLSWGLALHKTGNGV